MNFLGNNYCESDTEEREENLRKKVPELLEPDEHIVFALKARGGKGRDSTSFSTNRIIVKDKQGISGKKTRYTSIPYHSIQAWSIETPGGFDLDNDAQLKVHVRGYGTYEMDLVADYDYFRLNLFLTEEVLALKKSPDVEAVKMLSPVDFTPLPAEDTKTSFWDRIGDNAQQVDTEYAERFLRSKERPLLLPDETIELAFKCGRDTFLLTSLRILEIDSKGVSGKRTQYYSVTWPCVKGFSIETAGSFFDRDAELTIYTNVGGVTGHRGSGSPSRKRTRINVDFRKGAADLMSVQRFFADKILGMDDAEAAGEGIVAHHDMGGKTGFFSWMGDDSKMVDPNKMNEQYHSAPYPILQNSEIVEMAFKGRRDLVLFTTKRIIFIDLQGWNGKKVEFTSIPWKNCSGFAVQTAGSFMDKDSEMKIWTNFDDIYYPPQEGGENPPPPPPPDERMSEIKLDFQKDRVDLMSVHRYLSERILPNSSDLQTTSQGGGGYFDSLGAFVPALRPSNVPVSSTVFDTTPPSALETLMGSLTGDGTEIDPRVAEESLRANGLGMIQPDEHVALAYKAGRDTYMLTNKRILEIDTKGFSGKRVQYTSIPYHAVRGFEVESAGSWDRDADVKILTDAFGGSESKTDLKKGKADIVALQVYLAAQVFGLEDGRSVLGEDGKLKVSGDDAGNMSKFLDFVKDAGKGIDVDDVNSRLHSNPPILLDDESVETAYQMGRDMCVITTKRILMIDVQGFTGKKIEYGSYPLRYCTAFAVETAGKRWGSRPEVKFYMTGMKMNVDQDLSKSDTDIWAVQKIMKNKVLMR